MPKATTEQALTKTSLALPTELWEAAKIQATWEHRDLRDLMADGLRLYLARAAKKARIKRKEGRALSRAFGDFEQAIAPASKALKKESGR